MLTAVHQFVRIGEYASTSERSGIPADLIPFGIASGDARAASLSGLNLAELRRHGFPGDRLHELRQAYRLLFSPEGTLRERLADVSRMFGTNPLVRRVMDFIQSDTDRSFCVPGDASAFSDVDQSVESKDWSSRQADHPRRAG